MKYRRFVLATLVLAGVGSVAWYGASGLATAPRFGIQQFTLTPDQPSYPLQAPNTLRKTVVMPSPWSAVAIRYRRASATAALPSATLAISQGSQLISVAQNTRLVAGDPSTIDGTDFFTHDDWLFFELPILEGNNQTVEFELRPVSGTIHLPYQPDSTVSPDSIGSTAADEVPGNLNVVGLVRTGLSDHVAWSLSHGNRLGHLLGGLAIMLAVMLGWQTVGLLRSARQAWWPLTFLALFTILLALPLFNEAQLWGRADWTEVTAHFAAARQALQAGQFPLWNPYFCGGFPAWSNPQTYWPSATFLLALFTNDIIGTKIAVLLYSYLGAIGVYLLSRHLGTARLAAVTAGLLYSGNGFVAAHLSLGHLLWLAMAWLPWIVLFYAKSFKRPWYLVPSALGLVMVVIEGQVYFAVYTCLFLVLMGIVWVWHTGRLIALRRLGILALLTAGLGAVKVIPTALFVQSLKGTFSGGSYIPWYLLPQALLQRRSPDSELTPSATTGIDSEQWIYIGIIALALCLLGGLRAIRHKNRLYLGLAAIAVLSLLLAVVPAEFGPLHSLPFFSYLRTPTRSIVVSMLSLSLVAAYGTQELFRRVRRSALRRLIVIAVLGLLAADYLFVANPTLALLFSADPHGIPSAVSFTQTGGPTNSTYHLVTAGTGNPHYCPPHLRLWQTLGSVQAEDNSNYGGEIFSAEGSPVELVSVTPNQITVRIGTVAEADAVQLNQNYDSGWRSPGVVVTKVAGRLAFLIDQKNSGQTVTLSYRPRGLMLGLMITITTILLVSLVYISGRLPHLRRIRARLASWMAGDEHGRVSK